MKNPYNYFALFFLIFISRVVPHPPNFTPIIALSFYVPAILGIKFLMFFVLGYVVIDIFFGLHDASLFVWGSIIFISLLTKFIGKSFKTRLLGVLSGSDSFFCYNKFWCMDFWIL